uniref:Uncharacterized protein n=1 Tax=Zea mays TaxID=4577 RepID=A0A804PXH2_MAIZE
MANDEQLPLQWAEVPPNRRPWGPMQMIPRQTPALVATGMQWGVHTPPPAAEPPLSIHGERRSAHFALAHGVQGSRAPVVLPVVSLCLPSLRGMPAGMAIDHHQAPAAHQCGVIRELQLARHKSEVLPFSRVH